ncbi:GcrA family cell cycle regulator [Pararhizobium haloflavum]|uniref:GcrA family cell cycle regulator n=1 Tax=Pararhizobium haloflavum TaxID=2037914 RepID=UPI000C189235|nr:GcrA family cell cycle regulator [Pararhizobium haloflavum]
MNWTDERVEKLTKLWADGLSASQIAAQLGGVTRNAVIGKVHRLNLPGRAKSGGTAAPRAKRPAPAARPASNFNARPAAPRPSRGGAAPALREDVAYEPVQHANLNSDVVVPISRKLALTELTERTCKWPVGDPMQEDFHFCGNDSGEHTPYCQYHARLAFQPSAERRRAR